METKKGEGKERCYIICVDDDDAFLDSLSMVLPDRLSAQHPEFDYRFEFVNNVTDLFDLINDLKNEDEKVALIISDQKMPEMSGIELFEKVNKYLPDTMRVLLTGYGGLESAKYAINSHLLDQYITKPIDDYDNFISIISHLIKKFHLQLLKVKQEEEIKRHLNALQTANKRIEKMLKTAEEIAYFAKDIKMLDLDEILNLTIREIPVLFKCSNASIFLLRNESGISKLRLARSTHIKGDVELVMNDKEYLVKDIVKDPSGKVVDERVLNKEQYTPIQKAIDRESILIIPDVQKGKLRFLGKKELGKSCIIIPFIIGPGTKNRKQYIKEIVGVVNIGGMLNVSGLEINDEEMEFIKYKATLLKDILGANIGNAQVFAKTKKMAITDSLTGLYNNRMLNEFLNKEMERTKRYEDTFSVVVCDIDNFKRINDKYGHLTGDVVLRQLAVLLDQTKRGSDLLFRYGGEEFVFILPETDAEQTYPLIERIRRDVGNAIFDSITGHITLSFGISQYPCSEKKDEDAKEVLRRADTAMYGAKNKGKNRGEIFTVED